jgi:hypothetical protein
MMNRRVGIAIVVVAAIAIGAAVATKELGLTPRDHAWAMIQHAVRDRLKCPASAIFQEDGAERLRRSQRGDDSGFEDALMAPLYVDSQNGFGAMRRTRFRCFAFKRDGRWVIEGLRFET